MRSMRSEVIVKRKIASLVWGFLGGRSLGQVTSVKSQDSRAGWKKQIGDINPERQSSAVMSCCCLCCCLFLRLLCWGAARASLPPSPLISLPHRGSRLSTRLLTLANPWIQSGRQELCQSPQQRNHRDSCEQFTESMVLSQRITPACEQLAVMAKCMSPESVILTIKRRRK